MNFPLFSDEASTAARQTDYLYWALISISVATMAVVFGPIIIFLFKYRRGKKADRSPVHLPEMKIEIAWTIIPMIIFTGLFAWGTDVFWNIERPPANAMEIDVLGKQWMWKIQHPEGKREIDELHLPLGRSVKLLMASQDVIHSFFLPEFRIKQDVVPGRYTTLWLKANKLGTFHLFCSEYCGTHHSAMIGRVIVMEPAAYEDWLTHGEPAGTLAQSGERLYRELGCSGCHENSTIVHAPPLAGIFGKFVPLQTGQFVNVDEGYLRDSILLPAKDVAAGYTNAMPSFQGRVNEEQLLELISYIKTLGAPVPNNSTQEAK